MIETIFNTYYATIIIEAKKRNRNERIIITRNEVNE